MRSVCKRLTASAVATLIAALFATIATATPVPEPKFAAPQLHPYDLALIAPPPLALIHDTLAGAVRLDRLKRDAATNGLVVVELKSTRTIAAFYDTKSKTAAPRIGGLLYLTTAMMLISIGAMWFTVALRRKKPQPAKAVQGNYRTP